MPDTVTPVGFVGGGQMAEAIVGGMLGAKLCSSEWLWATDPVAARRDRLKSGFGIRVGEDNRALTEWADLVILAVKPQVLPRVLKEMDLRGPAVAFEVYLDAVPAARAKSGRSKPPLKLVDFPAVERDFAFIVDAGIAADALLKAVRGADKQLIPRVRVFDLFAGAGIPEGRKSVAL